MIWIKSVLKTVRKIKAVIGKVMRISVVVSNIVTCIFILRGSERRNTKGKDAASYTLTRNKK